MNVDIQTLTPAALYDVMITSYHRPVVIFCEQWKGCERKVIGYTPLDVPRVWHKRSIEYARFTCNKHAGMGTVCFMPQDVKEIEL